jgi:hypothetical protein
MVARSSGACNLSQNQIFCSRWLANSYIWACRYSRDFGRSITKYSFLIKRKIQKALALMKDRCVLFSKVHRRGCWWICDSPAQQSRFTQRQVKLRMTELLSMKINLTNFALWLLHSFYFSSNKSLKTQQRHRMIAALSSRITLFRRKKMQQLWMIRKRAGRISQNKSVIFHALSTLKTSQSIYEGSVIRVFLLLILLCLRVLKNKKRSGVWLLCAPWNNWWNKDTCFSGFAEVEVIVNWRWACLCLSSRKTTRETNGDWENFLWGPWTTISLESKITNTTFDESLGPCINMELYLRLQTLSIICSIESVFRKSMACSIWVPCLFEKSNSAARIFCAPRDCGTTTKCCDVLQFLGMSKSTWKSLTWLIEREFLRRSDNSNASPIDIRQLLLLDSSTTTLPSSFNEPKKKREQKPMFAVLVQR